nr:MAG TPA: hypothetical protein [Caudoviricetes sp.]
MIHYRKAVGYLAFLKNRWLFWLSPPDAPERPRTPPNGCEWVRIAANRYQSQLCAPFIKSY